MDADLNQGSYLILPFVILIVALFYHHKTVLPYVLGVYQQLSAAKSQQNFHKPGVNTSGSPPSPTIDNSIPAEFLGGSESSPVKKRAKPRKV